MSSTTIFTTVLTPSNEYLAVPRTLSLQKRKGSGKTFLDTTCTEFYRDWQLQLQAVFQFVQEFFDDSFTSDFFISIDSKAVTGWSTSVPLFLLFASALSEESLPDNIFSTGCMYSPDGWISHGKQKGIQAKIDALDAYVQYADIENPRFLVPYSYQYLTKGVDLYYVRSVFCALKIALPKTYKKYESKIETLSHVKSQDCLQSILEHIPPTGDVFVVVSTEDPQSEFCKTKINTVPLIYEKMPSHHAVFLYFVRDSKVMFKYSYKNTDKALAAASYYKEVLP